MEIAGETVTAYLQKKVSTPFLDGIASTTGQYPRLRTGSLLESIDFKVYKRSNQIWMKFGSLDDTRINGQTAPPTLYAVVLEHRKQRALTRKAWEDCKRNRVLRRALRRSGHAYSRENDLNVKIPKNPKTRGKNARGEQNDKRLTTSKVELRQSDGSTSVIKQGDVPLQFQSIRVPRQ